MSDRNESVIASANRSLRRVRKQIEDSEILHIQKEIYAQNPFELMACEVRNVLFLGKTRAGKTTAVSVLKDPCYIPKKYTIFSETVEAKFQSFAIGSKENPESEKQVLNFSVNVIDTPGLFESRSVDDNSDERSNEVIVNTITKCLENEIVKLHCVVIFASFESGVTKNDIDAIKIFTSLFGGTKTRLAICITRSERKDEEWKTEISNQLQKHRELGPLFQQFNIKIMFMGCVESPKNFTTSDDLASMYEHVLDMREEVLKFVFESKDYHPLIDLPVFTKKKKQIEGLIQSVINDFKYFSTVTEHQTQQVQNRMRDYTLRAQDLATAKGVSANIPELATKFYEVVKEGKEFLESKSSIPKEERKKLIEQTSIAITKEYDLN